jgi:predicted small secreted protein
LFRIDIFDLGAPHLGTFRTTPLAYDWTLSGIQAPIPIPAIPAATRWRPAAWSIHHVVTTAASCTPVSILRWCLRVQRRNRMESGTMIKLIAPTLALLGLLAAAPLLSACHTTSGMGQDISNTGKAIENSADKHTP